MDQDSRDFKLNFGPNVLRIAGKVINARLRGVTARSFIYKSDAGSLFAEDLTTGIDGADISSLSADLVVTTSRRTSLRFWQRDGNKVVLPNAQCSYAYTHGTHANIRRVTMPKRSINMLAGMPHCRSQKPARRWQLPPDVRLPACQSSGCWNLRFCGAYHEGGMRI